MKKKKSMSSEFKEFISKGNVIDLAVGVIIGGAFGSIVTSLVNDIIMPLIGILLGKIDFSTLSWEIGSAEVKYGMFIQNIVNFLIIAFVLFMVIKGINKFRKQKEEVKSGPSIEEETLNTLKSIEKQLKKK